MSSDGLLSQTLQLEKNENIAAQREIWGVRVQVSLFKNVI